MKMTSMVKISLVIEVILIIRGVQGDCSGPPYSLSCCTDASPCNENEGNCYYDSECIGDLICNLGDGNGQGNCPSKYPGYFDCCGKGKSDKILIATNEGLKAKI